MWVQGINAGRAGFGLLATEIGCGVQCVVYPIAIAIDAVAQLFGAARTGSVQVLNRLSTVTVVASEIRAACLIDAADLPLRATIRLGWGVASNAFEHNGCK
jgi:hypothetical protein